MFETIEKVLKAVKKKYFSWLKRPSRTATKNYVENNFRWSMSLLKKNSHRYQWVINIKLLVKTIEIYIHKYWLKYAYYFNPHALIS